MKKSINHQASSLRILKSRIVGNKHRQTTARAISDHLRNILQNEFNAGFCGTIKVTGKEEDNYPLVTSK